MNRRQRDTRRLPSGRKQGRRRIRPGIPNPFSGDRRRRLSEQLHEEAEKPYRYDSNRKTVLWITLALGIWIALGVAAMLADISQARMLSRWRDQGFVTAPPPLGATFGQDDSEVLVAFAEQNNIPCGSVEELLGGAPGCARIVEFSGDVNSGDDLSTMVFGGLVLTLLIAAALIASFAYQASRNLLTLKSEGQRFSPTAAMVWLFVPIVNIYRGVQIFSELWKGSDPEASTSDPIEWKARPATDLIPMWWLSFGVTVAGMFFGARAVGLFISGSTLQDQIDATNMLVIPDLLLIVPAVLGFIVIRGIHDRQQRRFRVVGEHLAVPKPSTAEPESEPGPTRR